MKIIGRVVLVEQGRTGDGGLVLHVKVHYLLPASTLPCVATIVVPFEEQVLYFVGTKVEVALTVLAGQPVRAGKKGSGGK